MSTHITGLFPFSSVNLVSFKSISGGSVAARIPTGSPASSVVDSSTSPVEGWSASDLIGGNALYGFNDELAENKYSF